VPDSAILRDAQNMPYVYVQTGNNQFGRRDVTIGDSRGGKTLITSGLQTGERLVGDGALFLQFQNSIQR
jgi:cobalt-zinc-cadmium efflux system membrane fusion protein